MKGTPEYSYKPHTHTLKQSVDKQKSTKQAQILDRVRDFMPSSLPIGIFGRAFGLRVPVLSFADNANQKGNSNTEEKKSPISGITNTDKGSPMRTSGSREQAKTVVKEKQKSDSSGKKSS